MCQQLTDAATEMFMERGFDGFRVADVAEACGVSEKTVFNYFSTKESLVLDRLDATIASLRTALVEPGVPPLEATMRVLDDELAAHTSWLASQDDPAQGAAAFQRFRDLIDATPSLRGYELDMMDQLAAIAAQLIADRAGMIWSRSHRMTSTGHGSWFRTATSWRDEGFDRSDHRRR
jgi:AcrR family transcriptional regulator